jgi:hypothetical protein
MPHRKPRSEQSRPGGRFTDANGKLPLFDDPHGRGPRRWKQTFGIEPVKGPDENGFIAREVRRS